MDTSEYRRRVVPGQLARLDPEHTPPLLSCSSRDVHLAGYLCAQREVIDALLLRHGALLLRGFGVDSAATLACAMAALDATPLTYTERSSPRTAMGGNIYTSTEYPADQKILMHNENAYAASWPQRIFFCCAEPARVGGATPLADCRKVLATLDPTLRQRFAARGLLYLRNFDGALGLSWQDAFQTSDPATAEALCRRAGYAVRWNNGGRLSLRRAAPATVTHPRTGEEVWFNHAAFFHPAALAPDLGQALQTLYAPDELPTNVLYGDGTPIEDSTIEAVLAAWQAHETAFAWQRGDLLVLDNLLVAHGRAPFTGPRRILVGMSDPMTSSGTDDGVR